METISTANAPRAIGPYSQATRYGDWIFCSGQIGMDPGTGALIGDSIENETRQVITNLQHVLEAAGAGLNTVTKVTIYLLEMSDFQAVNAVYSDFFLENRPARATVGVAALPRGARIEIDCIAHTR